MPGRNSSPPLSPNAPTPGAAPAETATEWSTTSAEAEKSSTRADSAAVAEALDETMTMREADSRRDVPRMRTDSLNPNKSRAFPGRSAARSMLSSNRKKEYNRTKTGWQRSMPRTRYHASRQVLQDQEAFESINRSVASTVGVKSEMSPSVRRQVGRLDAAIQDYERHNERQHIVYSYALPPQPTDTSRQAMVSRYREMIDNQEPVTFDRYIPADHSMGNLQDHPNDVVYEFRTHSGAYLGSSDTTPNAEHLIGRGHSFMPTAIQEDVEYTKPDGSRGTRTVIQMDDVPRAERTAART